MVQLEHNIKLCESSPNHKDICSLNRRTLEPPNCAPGLLPPCPELKINLQIPRLHIPTATPSRLQLKSVLPHLAPLNSRHCERADIASLGSPTVEINLSISSKLVSPPYWMNSPSSFMSILKRQREREKRENEPSSLASQRSGWAGLFTPYQH